MCMFGGGDGDESWRMISLRRGSRDGGFGCESCGLSGLSDWEGWRVYSSKKALKLALLLLAVLVLLTASAKEIVESVLIS